MRFRGRRHVWLPVLYGGAAVTVLAVGFFPFTREAREQSRRAAQLSRELEAKIAVIESLPGKQAELAKLSSQLGLFRASISSTREVDLLMSRFRSRAEEMGLELWTLNPSVPALIEFDAGRDSVARLDLAELPVSFECRGDFRAVARFLESEESRTDFYRWRMLTVSALPLSRGVQARGEFYLFLLPESSSEESVT